MKTVVCKKHWIMFLKPAIIEAVILYVAKVLFGLRQHPIIFSVKLINWSIAICFIAMLLIAVYSILVFTTERIVLTWTREVIYSSATGYGRIPSKYVQSVDERHSLLGFFLGYSTITLVLFGANINNITIKRLKNGRALAETLGCGHREI